MDRKRKQAEDADRERERNRALGFARWHRRHEESVVEHAVDRARSAPTPDGGAIRRIRAALSGNVTTYETHRPVKEMRAEFEAAKAKAEEAARDEAEAAAVEQDAGKGHGRARKPPQTP